jgi:hypothetical protein
MARVTFGDWFNHDAASRRIAAVPVAAAVEARAPHREREFAP